MKELFLLVNDSTRKIRNSNWYYLSLSLLFRDDDAFSFVVRNNKREANYLKTMLFTRWYIKKGERILCIL